MPSTSSHRQPLYSAVTDFEDLRDPEGRMGPLRGATDAAGRNVIVFRLGDAGSVVLRPSGTEPKAKKFLQALFEAGVIGFIAGAHPARARFLMPVGGIADEDIDAVGVAAV